MQITHPLHLPTYLSTPFTHPIRLLAHSHPSVIPPSSNPVMSTQQCVMNASVLTQRSRRDHSKQCWQRDILYEATKPRRRSTSVSTELRNCLPLHNNRWSDDGVFSLFHPRTSKASLPSAPQPTAPPRIPMVVTEHAPPPRTRHDKTRHDTTIPAATTR